MRQRASSAVGADPSESKARQAEHKARFADGRLSNIEQIRSDSRPSIHTAEGNSLFETAMARLVAERDAKSTRTLGGSLIPRSSEHEQQERP
jgi:hypothetical protein